MCFFVRAAPPSLPPPGGELTAQDDGDDCHAMAPRAITHNLSVRPPSPFLTASMGPRCYTCATQMGFTLRVCCTHQVLLFTLSSLDDRCSCWQEPLALQ